MLAKLVLCSGVHDEGIPSEFPLDREVVLIGRRPSSDVYLPLKEVSREHARMEYTSGSWFIEDLGSANGTFVNGLPIGKPVEVHDQDQIRIGPCLLRLESSAADLPGSTIQASLSAEFDVDRLLSHAPEQKLKLVMKIARDLGRNLNLDELLPLVLGHLLELFPKADRGLILTQSGDRLFPRAELYRNPGGPCERGFSRTVVAKVLKHRIGVVVGHEKDPSMSIQQLGIQSYMCVPLLSKDGRPYGVLQLDSFRMDTAFEQEDLEMLTTVATLLSTILENASLHNDLLQQEKIKRDLDLARLAQMVAGLAHEVNNPLAFVTNNVAILQRDLNDLLEVTDLYRRAAMANGDEKQTLLEQAEALIAEADLDTAVKDLPNLLDRSTEGLRRIREVVDDLRNFARLDQSEVDWVDLNVGIQSTVGTMQGLFKQKHVRLELHLGELPRIKCSPSKLNQAIFHIIQNALDACRSGGLVAISTSAADDEVRIVIEDNGCGIAEDDLPRIFDPFFTTKPLGKGMGLGLSLCYGIVRDHGGKIEVESELGKGTRFTISLPRDYAQAVLTDDGPTTESIASLPKPPSS